MRKERKSWRHSLTNPTSWRRFSRASSAARSYSCLELVSRHVANDALVAIGAARYSVPGRVRRADRQRPRESPVITGSSTRSAWSRAIRRPRATVSGWSRRITPDCCASRSSPDPRHRRALIRTTVLDAVSRKIVGWAMATHLRTARVLKARDMALGQRRAVGAIHHSDQGSQFTDDDFTGVLRDHQVAISMDGRGRFADNIFVERLSRSLKYEEVYLKAYASVAEARQAFAAYWEFYNNERFHQALDYRAPRQVFEQALRGASSGAGNKRWRAPAQAQQ